MTDADELQRLARRAAKDAALVNRHLQHALNTLNEQLANLDGYPTTASGADTGPTTHHHNSSIVEITATKRLGTWKPGPSITYDELADWILTCNKAARNALNKIEHLTGRHLTPAEKSAVRCAGNNTPTGATCHQIADPYRTDGRCLDCGRTIDDERARETHERRLRRHRNRNTA